jgi:UDP-glucose 4-epimerase
MSEAQFSVVVTGGAGYIGSRVITRLQDAHPEWEVTALDNFYVGDVRQIGDVSVRHVDIRHQDELERALSGTDMVIHLAAISGVDDCDNQADLAYEVNVVGTNNVAWFCHKTGAGLVFPYSMAVLGDPESFPITVEDGRDPLNWYGRTKLLGERAIEGFALDEFPVHMFMKSNLYGEHDVNGQRVSKGTVINFFVNRVRQGKPLTVYEPGTQARNYIHVDDIARAYVQSAERMREQLLAGETGVEKYEIASDEDPSVMTVAERVQRLAREELDRDVEIQLIENPRSGETLVDEFPVDTSKAHDTLGWEPNRTITDSVRKLLHAKTDR